MPPTASHPKRRSNVPVACNVCRQRKTQCSGERPACRTCEVRGVQCVYESIAATETPSGVLRRRQAEAQAQLDSYRQLFDALQQAAPVHALRILALVRSGADISSISRRLEGGDVRAQAALAPDGHLRYAFPYLTDMPRALLANRRNPYLTSRILRGTLGPLPSAHVPPSSSVVEDTAELHPAFLLPYHTATLIEPALEHVHAHPWTVVVQDDALVRRLLEVYLLYEYPFLTFFHKDNFLYDMRHGGKDFCSRLLVNAILACAAHGQRDASRRADFWLPETWSYRFEAEARRLWESESIRPSLTTVQAGLILSVTSNINGNDVIGTRYLKRTVELAREMDLFSPVGVDLPHRVKASRLITALGVFAWQATTAFHLHHAPLIEQHWVESLLNNDEISTLAGQLWVQYPLSNDPISLHHGITFKALIQFRLILNGMAQRSFAHAGGPQDLLLEEALTYRRELMTWWLQLPPQLAADDIVFPSHLKLHIHYHNALSTLFKPAAALYQTSLEHRELLQDELQSHEHPLEILIQAKVGMETLIRLYYLRHGFETWDSMMPQFISSVGFSAAEDLDACTDPDTRREILSTLILCIKGMYDQGKSMYVSEVIYRLLRGTLTAGDERLVRDFAEIEHEQERAILMEQHVNSAWPIRNAQINGNIEDDRIDSLVRKAAEIARGEE